MLFVDTTNCAHNTHTHTARTEKGRNTYTDEQLRYEREDKNTHIHALHTPQLG